MPVSFIVNHFAFLVVFRDLGFMCSSDLFYNCFTCSRMGFGSASGFWSVPHSRFYRRPSTRTIVRSLFCISQWKSPPHPTRDISKDKSQLYTLNSAPICGILDDICFFSIWSSEFLFSICWCNLKCPHGMHGDSHDASGCHSHHVLDLVMASTLH